MSEDKNPDVRYLLGVLQRADPAAWFKLGEALRGPGARLPSGGVLGNSRTGAAAFALTPHEAGQIAIEGLERMRAYATPALARMAARLRLSSRVGLAGQLVAAISSTGMVAAIWKAPAQGSALHTAAIAMAALSFVSACAGLVARHLQHEEIGDGAATPTYRKLSDAIWQAETTAAKLKLVLSRDESTAGSREGRKLIADAEALARDIHRLVQADGAAR